jgi:hypothetical protein
MKRQTTVEQICAVINTYINATYTSDIPALRSAFHKDAHMTGYLGDNLLIGTPEPFFDDMGSGPSMQSQNAPYKADIVLLSVTGRIASAVVRETGFRGSGTLENHFQLIEDCGNWSIISKNFTTV